MRSKYHAIRCILVAVLLMGIMVRLTVSDEPDLAKQTLLTIKNCMACSPGEWPDEWRQHYLETIHKAVEFHRDAEHFAQRLEILRQGFAACWEGLTKKRDESLVDFGGIWW